MSLTITGGFRLYTGTNTKALFLNDTYQVADDLTIVRGNHQFGFGANVQYWTGDYTSTSRANGNWIFDGSTTGLGLADFLTGRLTSVEHGGLGKLPVDNVYTGLYGQDSWRVSSRVTVNGGVRWEPYFGQNVRNGVISVFNMDNFVNKVHSTVFLKAPAGLLYAGDAGFPSNAKTGMNKQWWNLSPRGGIACPSGRLQTPRRDISAPAPKSRTGHEPEQARASFQMTPGTVASGSNRRRGCSRSVRSVQAPRLLRAGRPPDRLVPVPAPLQELARAYQLRTSAPQPQWRSLRQQNAVAS